MPGADSGHKHLGESLRHLRFRAAVAVEDLRVELAFPVSGYLDLLDPTGRRDQITAVGAVAIPFALRATFSSTHPDQCIEFLTHHPLQHYANGVSGQFTQMVLEGLLLWQRGGCLLWR